MSGGRLPAAPTVGFKVTCRSSRKMVPALLKMHTFGAPAASDYQAGGEVSGFRGQGSGVRGQASGQGSGVRGPQSSMRLLLH